MTDKTNFCKNANDLFDETLEMGREVHKLWIGKSRISGIMASGGILHALLSSMDPVAYPEEYVMAKDTLEKLYVEIGETITKKDKLVSTHESRKGMH